MAAGDEQHRDWSDARNEERIMIGAAHHGEKTLAHSNGCNSVYRSAGERRILDGQNQFRSSAKCVLAISHKDSTGVSTGAFDRNPETRRRSDMSDDAECDALAFQDRPLLNVQFHECLVVASCQLYCCEFACKASRESNLLERCSIAVSQLAGRVGRAGSGKQAASQASDAKARWFFRSEHEQFNRMFRTKPRLP